LQDNYKQIELVNGSKILTKAVIIASGMTYRKHPAKGIDRLTGRSVYYGAATTEAIGCINKKVFIVGGGNSAGQGAVYLSNYAVKVTILIRKPDLSSSMSQYLIDQIDAISNIEVRGYTEIVEAIGEEHLEELVLKNNQTNQFDREAADTLFVFIGTRPNSSWFQDLLLLDSKGFVITGRSLVNHEDYGKLWHERREPMSLETNVPGIFAVGDIRSGSMNRVASAVGEGSMSIKLTHEYLAQV
jgi:thioredoxin reductase (NADPH)